MLTGKNLIWASENPRFAIANPLHPEKVKVCYISQTAGIYGPIIFSCLYRYADCGTVPFPNGVWHSDEFSLVSRGWYQTSGQHCHTLLSL
jgi:hypothetical protein